MRLSSKSRYGIRAVFDIAFFGRGDATRVRKIAERQEIPARFLEQIFQDLKRADLVVAKRGPKGGYLLAKDPSEVRIGDVVRALEGPVTLSEADATGIVDEALTELEARVETELDVLNIADLCERAEAAGIRRAPPRRYVYSI